MTEGREPVNFDDLIEATQAGLEAPEEGWPAIVAATFPVADLAAWLEALELRAYGAAIWSYTDRVAITQAVIPARSGLVYLTEARLFGPGGDLMVWRDRDHFCWRFVGIAANCPARPADAAVLPWPDGTEAPVFWRESVALLWGHRTKDRDSWYDDRVAGADLGYPVEGTPERVRVRYYEFTQAGRPFAVWFRGLEGHNG